MLITFVFYNSQSIQSFIQKEIYSDLINRIHILQPEVKNFLASKNYAKLQKKCEHIGKMTNTRITVILINGTVVCDSDANPQKMENHINRPEVQEALKKRKAKTIRYSKTLNQNLIYVALAISSEHDETIGITRLSVSLSHIDSIIQGHNFKLILAALIIAIISGLISLFISRRIITPLETMSKVAQKFAEGSFKHDLPESHTYEIKSLADSLKQMGHDLSKRIKINDDQRNQIEFIFESMTEGIIAFDKKNRIINLNQAAANLMGIDPISPLKKEITEINIQNDIYKFIEKTLEGDTYLEDDIIIEKENLIYIQAKGSILKDHKGKRRGAIIVLNDISRIKTLENLRREFVANVSHELKTPLTSIKGFAETLVEEEQTSTNDTKKFLNIIAKQADRLTDIIDDLLKLAKIEREAEKNEIDFDYSNLLDILKSSINFCETKWSNRKNFKISIDCPDHIVLFANLNLIEQAFTNLIDNALKYSDVDPILINIIAHLDTSTNYVVIKFCDNGKGIDKKHLPRLFERFYRVDKSRSRESGGTGLGLAIVKHIIEAHHGLIHVESTVNKGTEFTVKIPYKNV